MSVEFKGLDTEFTGAIGYALFDKPGVSPPCNFLDMTEIFESFWAAVERAIIDFFASMASFAGDLWHGIFPKSASLGGAEVDGIQTPRHAALGEWQRNSSMEMWKGTSRANQAAQAAFHTQAREHDLSRGLYAEGEFVDDAHARFASVLVGGDDERAVTRHDSVSSALGAAVAGADEESSAHLATMFEHGILKKGAHTRVSEESLPEKVSSACAVSTGGEKDDHAQAICKGASIAAAVSCNVGAADATPRAPADESLCAGSLSRLASPTCAASYSACADAIIHSIGCSSGCADAVAALPGACGGVSPRFHHGGFSADVDAVVEGTSPSPSCSSAFSDAQLQCQSDVKQDATCASLLAASPAGMQGVLDANHHSLVPLAHSWAEGGARGGIHAGVACGRRVSMLDLSDNQFMGTVPECIVDGSVAPNHVQLHNNRLTGTLPTLGEHVRHLNVGRNALSGDLGAAAHPAHSRTNTPIGAQTHARRAAQPVSSGRLPA